MLFGGSRTSERVSRTSAAREMPLARDTLRMSIGLDENDSVFGAGEHRDEVSAPVVDVYDSTTVYKGASLLETVDETNALRTVDEAVPLNEHDVPAFPATLGSAEYEVVAVAEIPMTEVSVEPIAAPKGRADALMQLMEETPAAEASTMHAGADAETETTGERFGETGSEPMHGGADADEPAYAVVLRGPSLRQTAQSNRFELGLHDPFTAPHKNEMTVFVVKPSDNGEYTIVPVVMQQRALCRVESERSTVLQLRRETNTITRADFHLYDMFTPSKEFLAGAAEPIKQTFYQLVPARMQDESGFAGYDTPVWSAIETTVIHRLRGQRAPWLTRRRGEASPDAQFAKFDATFASLNEPRDERSYAVLRKALDDLSHTDETLRATRSQAAVDGRLGRFQRAAVLWTDETSRVMRDVLQTPLFFEQKRTVARRGAERRTAVMQLATNTPTVKTTQASPFKLGEEDEQAFVDASAKRVKAMLVATDLPAPLRRFLVRCGKVRFQMFRWMIYQILREAVYYKSTDPPLADNEFLTSANNPDLPVDLEFLPNEDIWEAGFLLRTIKSTTARIGSNVMHADLVRNIARWASAQTTPELANELVQQIDAMITQTNDAVADTLYGIAARYLTGRLERLVQHRDVVIPPNPTPDAQWMQLVNDAEKEEEEEATEGLDLRYSTDDSGVELPDSSPERIQDALSDNSIEAVHRRRPPRRDAERVDLRVSQTPIVTEALVEMAKLLTQSAMAMVGTENMTYSKLVLDELNDWRVENTPLLWHNGDVARWLDAGRDVHVSNQHIMSFRMAYRSAINGREPQTFVTRTVRGLMDLQQPVETEDTVVFVDNQKSVRQFFNEFMPQEMIARMKRGARRESGFGEVEKDRDVLTVSIMYQLIEDDEPDESVFIPLYQFPTGVFGTASGESDAVLNRPMKDFVKAALQSLRDRRMRQRTIQTPEYLVYVVHPANMQELVSETTVQVLHHGLVSRMNNVMDYMDRLEEYERQHMASEVETDEWTSDLDDMLATPSSFSMRASADVQATVETPSTPDTEERVTGACHTSADVVCAKKKEATAYYQKRIARRQRMIARRR